MRSKVSSDATVEQEGDDGIALEAALKLIL
jgi:hypothetical protein